MDIKDDMQGLVHIAAKAVIAWRHIYARSWSFLGLFVLIFVGSTLTLARMDLLPNNPFLPKEVRSLAAVVDSLDSADPVIQRSETPTRVVIASLGVDSTIANPETTDITTLDQLLLSGAVRYPTSAKLGEAGNVVLFGHSSYLPVVGNKAYKTFNEIQNLEKGDRITVYSATRVYTYAVRSVSKEDAEQAAIPLDVSGQVLTLATCDSFGKKTDRFVVVADLVDSHLIGA